MRRRKVDCWHLSCEIRELLLVVGRRTTLRHPGARTCADGSFRFDDNVTYLGPVVNVTRAGGARCACTPRGPAADAAGSVGDVRQVARSTAGARGASAVSAELPAAARRPSSCMPPALAATHALRCGHCLGFPRRGRRRRRRRGRRNGRQPP